MRKNGVLLLYGVVIMGVLLIFQGDMNDSKTENLKDSKTLSLIIEKFEAQKVNLDIIADTLPENHVIQGGETSENRIYVKNNVSGQKYYNEDIKDIHPSLYAALCDLQKDHFQFISIERCSEYVTFTTEIQEFTSFAILHISDNATLENVLAMYDGYTVLTESEWYIVWRTRRGV